MVKRYDRLSNFQYSSLISSTIIGVIVISLPKLAATSAKEGAVLSTILCGILTIIIAICITILGKRFYKSTLIEYSSLLLGKILGKLFGFVVILYFIVHTSAILRNFSDALKGLLLENTPLEVIMISMLFTIVYLILNGINGIAKWSELFLPIIIISLLLVTGFSITNFSLVRFRPMLTPSFICTIRGIPSLITAFQGYEIIFLIIPFMHSREKTIPYTIIGVGVPVVLYILLVAMAIGVFGLKTTQQLNYATITLAEEISFPNAFAERFDIFFVILWILAAFTTIANFFYMSSLATVRLLGLRNYQPIIYLLTPVVYILAILPQNLLEIRIVIALVGYFGLGISAFAIGLLILALILGKTERENA